MTALRRGVVCILLMFIALTFFACELPTLPDLSCSGTITFNDLGLQGVSIKSDVKEFALTDEDGKFTFSTKAKTITIHPVLDGYMFQPKEAVLSEGENTANFLAIKIESLEGTLTLNKVVITPTSISSSPDNYVFADGGKEALKVSNISISYENTIFLMIDSAEYLYKNERNEFSFPAKNTQPQSGALDEISFDCAKPVRIGILVNAYFSKYYQEWQTTDIDQTYLDIIAPPTNADIENGQVQYHLYAINNKARAFTLDISFVFDFIPQEV